MTSLWEALVLGLVLGVRHAFDADHLVAVSTIVSEYRNPLRAIWIGVSWGLGHTTTLLLAGIGVLLLHLRIPENLSLWFEFAVGVMLVLLGIQTFLAFRQRKVHIHSHSHPGDESGHHQHFHSHEAGTEHSHHTPGRWENLTKFLVAGITAGEHKPESTGKSMRPFFRLKSYVVGTVHGVAGSAALMLVVLASMKSMWEGVTYILVFGLGSVVSMGIISIFTSLPFTSSSRAPRLNRTLRIVAGTLSIVFGLVLMYQIWIAGILY